MNTGIGLSFTGRQITQVQEISIRGLCDFLYGLEGKFALESIVEQEGRLVEYFGEGQGSLEITVANGELRGCFYTALMGPGFHQTAVELLDRLAAELTIQLEVQDQTGYWQERDFSRLQTAYVRWLQEALTAVVFCGEQQFFDWEQGVEWAAYGKGIPVRSESVLTPMGAFTAGQIKSLAQDNGWKEFARDYFIWFQAEQDAYYYRNAALYDMWNKKWEVCQATVMINRLKKARSMDALIPIPLQECSELAAIAGETAEFSGPDFIVTGTLGYCRGAVRYQLPRGWNVTVPGVFDVEYSYDDDDNEQYPITFWHEAKQIRFLYAFNSEDETIDEQRIWQQQKEHTYLCIDEFIYGKGAEEYRQWNAQVRVPGKAIMVELEGKTDSWSSWAMEVFASIFYAGKA